MTVRRAGGRRLGVVREEGAQFVLLTRHFFARLFRNDAVDFEDQMKERLIAVLSILAMIVGWSSEMILFKYHFVPDVNLSWQEKNYLFTLIMIIFGMVTLLEWDVLFPDRRDFLNLAPLPVRLRTIFAAKLASFMLFVGLFSSAMNSLSSLLFAMNLAQWRSNSVLFALRHVLAHLTAAFAACFFVLFACVFLQSLLMAALTGMWYRRASTAVRFVLLAGLVFLLLAFLVEPGILDRSFRSLAELKELGAPFLRRFPPLWFVGLYEALLGTRDPIFLGEARTAALAVAFSMAAFVLAGGLSYYRHVLKTLESRSAPVWLADLREVLAGCFRKLVLWTPEERAVFLFFGRTVRTSPKHRSTMSSYLAAATGVIGLYIVGMRGRFGELVPGNVNLLVQPLFLSFVLLAAVRSVVEIPAAPEANWVFQVTETPWRRRYVTGLKKAIFFKWLAPLAGLVLAVHAPLWGFGPALGHAAFGLTVSGLGLEGFFLKYRKVPFACTFVPGKARLHARVVVLIFLSLIFLAAVGGIEKELLREPRGFLVFFGVAAVAWGGLELSSARLLGRAGLIYEEEPARVMSTFPEGP
jgi:hypothetical protein